MNQRRKGRIAVVTDSTAYLPAELIQEYDIHVVPLVLIMGEHTWRDAVDIDPPAFYELLRTSPDFPGTSQPSVSDFQNDFLGRTDGNIGNRLGFESSHLELNGIVARLDSNESVEANLVGYSVT